LWWEVVGLWSFCCWSGIWDDGIALLISGLSGGLLSFLLFVLILHFFRLLVVNLDFVFSSGKCFGRLLSLDDFVESGTLGFWLVIRSGW
jgi:hypothetical protein